MDCTRMEKQVTKKKEVGWLLSKPSTADLVIPVILPARTGTKRMFSGAQKSGLLTLNSFPMASKEHFTHETHEISFQNSISQQWHEEDT